MQQVRVKRGWSYGAYSSLPLDRHRQAFSMWTFPKSEDAAACLKVELEMLSEWVDTSLDEVNAALRRRLDPTNLVVALVGTSDRVLADVQAVMPDATTEVIPFDSETL